MRISLDTSIIVEIERKNEKIIEVIEKLMKKHEIFISAVVSSEIFTGTYLREDYEKATKKAKKLFLKNKKHFSRILELSDKVLTPDEVDRII